MAQDLNLAIVITADGRQVQATVNGVTTDLTKLGTQGERAGQQLGRGFGPSLQQAFQRTGSQLLGMTRQMFSLHSAIGLVAGSAGLGALLRSALAAADALEETSQRLGIGIERLQELQFGARLAGVDAGEFENALRFLNRSAAEAAQGTGEAIEIFQQLGVSVQNADGSMRSLDAILLDVADGFATLTDAQSTTDAAMTLFSRSGAQMIPVLQGGADGIQALADQARAAGAVMEEGLVQKAAAVNDQLDALGAAFRTNFQTGLLDAVVGSFGDLHELLTDPGFQHDVREFGRIVGEVLAFAVENFDKIVVVFSTIAGAVTGSVAGPWGAAFGGAAGFLAGTEITDQTDILEFLGLKSESVDEQLGELQSSIEAARERLAIARADYNQELELLGSVSTTTEFETNSAQQELDGLEEKYASLLEMKLNLQTAGAPGVSRPGPSLFGTPIKTGDVEDPKPDPWIETQVAIEGFIQSLRDEQVALSLGNAEREVATNIMQAQQIAIDGNTLLTEEQAEAIRRVTLANLEARKAEEDRNKLLEEGAALTEAMKTPTEVYTDRVRDLTDMLRAGAIGQVTFDRAVADAKETLDEADETAQAWQEGMQDLGSVISTQFEDAVLEGKKLSEVFQALLQDIERIIFRILVTKPLENFFAELLGGSGGGSSGGGGIFDIFGSIFGGGGGGVGHHPTSAGGGIFDFVGSIFSSIFHEGGVAGGPAPQRLVPPGAFAGAARYHSGGFAGMGGFAADEVPAILKRGEPVFPASGVMRGSLGGTIVNIIDQRGRDAPALQQRRRSGGGGLELVEIIIPAIKDAFATGRMDGVMRESFGLARAGS